MQEIGGILRRAREARGATLREAQAATKISLKYLEALECGSESAFPGEVYLKGFLRTYAEFLGLDGWDMVRQYRESRSRRERAAQELAAVGPPAAPRPARRAARGTAAREAAARETAARETGAEAAGGGRARRRARRPAPVVRPDRSLMYAALLLLLLAAAGILLSHYLAGLGTGGGSPGETAGPAWFQPAPPAPATQGGAAGGGDSSSGSGGGRPVQPGGGGQGAGPPGQVVAVGENPFKAFYRVAPPPIALAARCTGRCWVSVIADGALVVEETLQEGDARTWRAQSALRLRAGNPGTLFISVNGHYLGAAGDDGVPRDLEFSAAAQ